MLSINQIVKTYKALYQAVFMLVKLLGFIDLVGSLIFLLLVFSMVPPVRIVLILAGLLLLKGLFILTGEIPLSLIDIFASFVLIFSIFLSVPTILLWIPAFLLLAKGFVSFL